MKFKICIVMLFLNWHLQAGDFQHHPDTLNMDEKLLNHAKLREDRWKYFMLDSVKELDNPDLDRAQFHNIRVTGRKICEDAPDCQDITDLLDVFDQYHKYGQFVSKTALNKRRIALKQIYNKRIDAENRKNQDNNLSNSTIVGSAPTYQTVTATPLNHDNK